MSAARFACLVAAAALASACLRESVQTTVDARPMGRFTGPSLGGAEPRIHVVLHTGHSKLFAEAMFVGTCATFDVVQERRIEHVKNEVGAFPIVMTILAAGIAMSVYAYPELEPQESAVAGTTVLATGGAIYGVTKALESESVRHPPPRSANKLGPPTPCVLRPIASERMTVLGGGKTLSAETDPWGRATFAENVSGPYRVLLGQRPADAVEIRE